ncbi:MAG TPA: phosphatase PAP2 family protein [Candidatus Saccharimonadaceae bacterium]|jgi:membrane-associated phospholipid phosphatase|nr:phosphatase PAP2 family protein [Candidatus Saccharimonadaceae bacterium]
MKRLGWNVGLVLLLAAPEVARGQMGSRPGSAPAASANAATAPRTLAAAAPTARADGAALFRAHDVTLAALVVAATFGVAANDAAIRGDVLRHDSGTSRDLARLAQPLGNAAVIVPALALTYLGARASGRRPLADATERVTLSVGVAGVAALAIKEVAGRRRPNSGGDPDDFRPFSGNVSFPSGHATVAFALASALDRESGAGWVRWVAYPAAGLVAWSRLRDDEHWASDVVFGGALGAFAAARVDDRLRARAASGAAHALLRWSRGEPQIGITRAF